MSGTTIGQTAPPYVDDGSAEFVYFHLAPAYGLMACIIQIELASRIPDGGLDIKFVATARLRCSSAAAAHLRDALNGALEQLEQLQQGPITAASKLN